MTTSPRSPAAEEASALPNPQTTPAPPTISQLTDLALSHLKWSPQRPCLHPPPQRLRKKRRTSPQGKHCLAASISAQCVPAALARLIHHVLVTGDSRLAKSETMGLVLDVVWMGQCERHSKMQVQHMALVAKDPIGKCIQRIVAAVREVVSIMPPPLVAADVKDAVQVAVAAAAAAEPEPLSEEVAQLIESGRQFREEMLEMMEKEALKLAEGEKKEVEAGNSDCGESFFDFEGAASDGVGWAEEVWGEDPSERNASSASESDAGVGGTAPVVL